MDRIDDHPEVIIKWLSSPDGEEWSKDRHKPAGGGIMVSIKEDAPDYCEGWGVTTDNEDEPVFLWYAMSESFDPLYDA